jgi:hypothetical protein
MERKPADKENEPSGRYSKAWWRFVAADIDATHADRKRTWGDIDEMLLVRYEAGECTKEEKARVEQAMRDFPAVRESIEIGRELKASDAAAPVADDDQGQKRSGQRPWADLTDRSDNGPETTR